MNKYTSNDHTFCLCAYGESPFLESCVRSLLSQTIESKIIVATATPNSLIESLCTKYSFKLYVREGSPNIASDWNFALSKSDTPLATVAHQDDVYEPLYAERLLTAVNESKNPLIFFTDYGEIRNNDRVNSNRLLNTKRKMLMPLKNKHLSGSRFVRRRILSLGSPICCPSVSFVMPNLNVPIFKVGMKANLDWQAWESISKLHGEFLYDPEILMYHRIHEESETSNLIESDIRKNEDYCMFREFWPRPIAKILNKAYEASRNSNSLDSQ